MSKLLWGQVGSRLYETGIDRGVLYVNSEGFAWSGLVSVKEAHVGGESKAYYVDGVRYANRVTLEEYEATIDAYTYPEQFAVCDGTKSLGNGLFVTQQRRKSFSFSYRTLVGNDVEGLTHGYKLHVVYDALAEPVDREYQTLNEAPEPFLFSWKVVTKPSILEFIPTSHFVIDSRMTPDGILGLVEDILYGTDQQAPRLPSAGELAFLFSTYEEPLYDAGGPDDVAYYTFDGGAPTTTVYTATIDAGVPVGVVYAVILGGTPGTTVFDDVINGGIPATTDFTSVIEGGTP